MIFTTLFHTDDLTHNDITINTTILEHTVTAGLWTPTVFPFSMYDLHSTLSWGSIPVSSMALYACVYVCVCFPDVAGWAVLCQGQLSLMCRPFAHCSHLEQTVHLFLFGFFG